MTFEKVFHTYLLYKLEITKRGQSRCQRGSVNTTESRLTKFLAPVWLDEPRDFSAEDLVTLLHSYSNNGQRASTTVYSCFREVRAMLRWMARKQLVEREWTHGILEHDLVLDALEDYPNEASDGVQLELDEAIRFAEAAFSEAELNPHSSATGALLALCTGMRAKEIITRTARHVNDGGRQISVTRGKTKKATRPLKVPSERLRLIVCRAVEGLRPDDRIFQYTRHALYETVNRICRDCDVTEVGCHGLRRTFSTTAIVSGAAEEAVAKAMGHTSFAVTKKHYVAPGSVEQSQADAVVSRLRVD
jgi:integrase